MNKDQLPIIYDEGDGISIEFPINEGTTIKMYMEDVAAQQMINIIQNKLNARL